MLKNYIKIALRNIKRNKTFGFINIFGLAVGLAVFFMICLYVLHELSYDRFIPDADKIVRIIQKSETGYTASNPPGLAAALEEELPGVDVLTNIARPARRLLKVDEESIYVDGVLPVDKNFLEVFPFRVLQGSGSVSLAEPGNLLLTESVAQKLFGAEDPIGQIVLIENELEFEVAGIIEDPPSNFHFTFNVLLSLTTENQRKQRYERVIHWNFWTGGFTYVRLTPGTSKDSFQYQLTHFVQQQVEPEHPSVENHLVAQPLTDIHLARNVRNEIAPQGNRAYILLFSVVGLLILGIAMFNYMNLSMAQAVRRTQEVGIRKVSGASKGELICQFLGESLLISLFAFPLALLILELLFPMATVVLNMEFAYSVTDYPHLLISALGLALVSGGVAGSYPALILSSMQPAGMLKNWGSETRKSDIRKILVTVQFAISVTLIICTLIIWKQMQYVQQKQLGFDSENVLTFTAAYLEDRYPVFKQELMYNPRVASVSAGPAMGIGHKNMTMQVEDAETGESRMLSVMNTDYDYIGLMGVGLIAGRDFSPERAIDGESAVIINESAVRLLGLDDNPVGNTLTIGGVEKEIIGVTEDFHNESLYTEITPVAFQLHTDNIWTGLVKLAPGNLAEGIEELETVWNQFLPGRPFEFTFLDDQIEALYRHEQRIGILFSGFSGIAILIAGLGLFGLAVFITTTRTKEIGIRKVMGASVTHIIALINKDFLKLVLLGFVIAVPIAWYAMNRWLEDFAYRIEIGPGVFLLAGLAAVLIALATVSWQSVRAAVANPVEALRSE